MNRIYLLFIIINLFFTNFLFAQEENPQKIIEYFEKISKQWHTFNLELENFEGFKKYCGNKTYKSLINEIIRKVHHYDSIILKKINDPAYEMNQKERAKILKEVNMFETKYSMLKFLKTVKRECRERREIEHDKKNTKRDFADNSYDGQKIILESELYKYSRQITKRIDHINKYLHHLELHEITFK